MKAFKNFDKVQAAGTPRAKLPAGGYVGKVIGAKVVEYNGRNGIFERLGTRLRGTVKKELSDVSDSSFCVFCAQFAYGIGGDDGGGNRQHPRQFRNGERCGAKQTAAEIQKEQLHRRNRRHDR